MPRKKKTVKTSGSSGPTQGEIARLIQDSFDIFSNELLTRLASEQALSLDDLATVKESVQTTSQDIKNRTIDQLIKHY